MKNYDVWFTLENPAVLTVEANSAEEAEEIAEGLLEDMDHDDLMERINNALDFAGIKITNVTEC